MQETKKDAKDRHDTYMDTKCPKRGRNKYIYQAVILRHNHKTPIFMWSEINNQSTARLLHSRGWLSPWVFWRHFDGKNNGIKKKRNLQIMEKTAIRIGTNHNINDKKTVKFNYQDYFC